MRHIILIAPVLSLGLLLSSCGGSVSTPVTTGQPGGQTGGLTGGPPVITADFSLSLSASSVTLAAGESKTVTVTVSRLSGFAGDVALSTDTVAGLSVQVNGAALTVTNTGMTVQSATLNVKGVSGGLSHTAALNVLQASAQTPTPTPTPAPADGAPALDVSSATLEENGTVSVRVLNLKPGDTLKYGGTVPGITQTFNGNNTSVWTLQGAASMIPADVDQTFLVTRSGQEIALHLKLHVNGHKVLAPSYSTRTANADEHHLLDLVNGVRATGATCGGVAFPAVPALTWNDALFNAAYNHSQDQLARNYYEHLTPEGVTPSERAFLAGYRPLIGAAENLFKMAFGNGNPASASADEAFKGWMNSDGHCRNIMDGTLKDFGAASSDGQPIPNGTGTADTMTFRMWSMELGKRS